MNKDEGVEQRDQRKAIQRKSHMPSNSVFFEKIVPILLLIMGVVMAGLVLFAAAVLFGLVRF